MDAAVDKLEVTHGAHSEHRASPSAPDPSRVLLIGHAPPALLSHMSVPVSHGCCVGAPCATTAVIVPRPSARESGIAWHAHAHAQGKPTPHTGGAGREARAPWARAWARRWATLMGRAWATRWGLQRGCASVPGRKEFREGGGALSGWHEHTHTISPRPADVDFVLYPLKADALMLLAPSVYVHTMLRLWTPVSPLSPGPRARRRGRGRGSWAGARARRWCHARAVGGGSRWAVGGAGCRRLGSQVGPSDSGMTGHLPCNGT